MKNFLAVISFVIIIIADSTNCQEDLDNSAQSIKSHMQFLASDVFEGRGTGTTGGELAAKYIALEYEKYGLITVGNETSYYQNIPMHGSFPLQNSELKLYQGDEEILLHLNEDYLLYKSGQQTFQPARLQMIFVGYGIIAPEFDYNDYQSENVEGKIVVFIDGEPESDDIEFFNGELPTIYSAPVSKQRIAISRGAAGSILIPTDLNFVWEEQVNNFAFEDVSLAYSASGNLSLLINPQNADLLFKNSNFTYDQILQMKKQNKIKSFPLETELTFRGEFLQRDFITQNIVGMIEGSDKDLKDSYLIISAHYDHLGIGPPVAGDSIYNGALDNAIGVSVMLEIANTLSELIPPPKRSIIFIALTGEEKGLLGSAYYTDNPPVPLYKTIANINIDGIALFRNFNSVVGIGSEYSTLNEYLYQTAQSLNLKVEDVPKEFDAVEAFNQSDQLSFAIAGVPSLLVLEGLYNPMVSRDSVLNAFIDFIINRYHTPKDDLNQNIDYIAAAQHKEVLLELILSIANSEETPEWNTGSPYINARLRSIAEKR